MDEQARASERIEEARRQGEAESRHQGQETSRMAQDANRAAAFIQEARRQGEADARRQARETSRRTQDAGRVASEAAGVTAETAAVWADANQRAIREVYELSTETAKEAAKCYGQLQQTAIELCGEMQAAMFRHQALWPEAFRDPLRWYQDVVMNGVSYAQRHFRLVGGTAEALARSVERLQATAEERGKGIQETFSTATSRMRDLYSEAERMTERAA
jgi:hypothetical protein